MSDSAARGTRNPIGWGFVEQAIGEAEARKLVRLLGGLLGSTPERRSPVDPETIELPAPRLPVPAELRGFVSDLHGERLLRAAGRSFRDLVALRTGRVEHAPDLVACPANEDEVERVLAWADARGVGVIPFGGGSSVVGGVNPEVPGGAKAGVVTLDLQRLRRVREIDVRSRVVDAEAGILGPDLDLALEPHGLSVRHYPQSYHHSTLGGWVATRGAGHFSTLHAKLEDRVQALRVLLPDGRRAETRPLPASSVGPDPNRLWAGSEGALGVLLSVRLRAVAVPEHRRTVGVSFPGFAEGLEAVRAIVQAGLWPAQLRLLDSYERMVSAAMAGGRLTPGAYLIVGFEGPLPVDGALAAALELAQSAGGTPEPGGEAGDVPDGVGSWRSTFFRQPYLRDVLIDHGVVADTFETAVPWSRIPEAYAQIRQATLDALQRVCGQGGVLCRTTHAYPDGVSLYFSLFGRGTHTGMVSQWAEVKAAASEAVLAAGGTISHHHAMGRDHAQWATAELPEAFRSAMRAARRDLDPRGTLNPGLWFGD